MSGVFCGYGIGILLLFYLCEAVPKLQFLEQQLMKTAVLQPAGRKTARACHKITDFGTGSCDRL
jgi:hypothetical protein